MLTVMLKRYLTLALQVYSMKSQKISNDQKNDTIPDVLFTDTT